MYDKAQYARRKFWQVFIPAAIAAALALAFVLFSLLAWTLGHPQYVQDGLFAFCLLIVGSFVPLSIILVLVTGFLILVASKQQD